MAKQCLKSGLKHTFPASSTNFNKNVNEYLFLDEENQLIGVAWNNQSKDLINYRRDFRQVQFKSILRPLTLVNPADEAKAAKLSTKELNTLKEKSWSECQYLDLKLEGGQTYAVLFKSIDGRYEKDIFKSVGLL